MSTAIPIVPYERERHEPAFVRFTEKVLGADICVRRQRIIETFHDRMPGREREPLRHVVFEDDQIVGTLGYMPADFLVGGERMRVRYTHDLFIDPAYWGRMLGKRLIAETLSRGDFFPGGMWMTHTCYQLHLYCGFNDAPPLTTLTSVLDPGAFVSKRDFSRVKSAAVRVGLEGARMLGLKRAHHTLGRAGASLEEVARFDAAMDPAWLDLLQSYSLTRVRDAAYLNWKYADHPLLKYRIVLAARGGRPHGFLIWRPAPGGAADERAVIVDFLVAKGDDRTLQELTARALVDAFSAGIEAVAVLTTQSWARAALRRFGFLPRPSRNTWVVGGWHNGMPQDWLKDADRWHMCLGDSDGDIWTGSM